ncbi:photosystem I reaction center subunit XI [Synechococcus sp. PCC 7336]|uniref:photosystem I reaction center subunit XI n=1 Tax=Synechococcus sp. PCC 7336 TaxID=195250 RepID=UPI0003484A83|nr:photosystem I reaction center subunit XI [Synechococcus sp. PCC 7336]
MTQSKSLVSPPDGDAQIGNFLTPVNNSPAVKFFLDWLPYKRPGMAPLARGLEIGMAHGYWLVGPFALLGPLRNEPVALVAGFLAACTIVLLMTMALSIYSYVTDDGDVFIGSKEGWSMFSSGFLVGGFGGAITAYLLIANADLISMLPGFMEDFQHLAG